tara:strand:+ start:475 stop:669 length:195 start_codon:yes stop_codon:yes gene_type:complete
MRIFGFIVIIGYIRIMFFFIGQTTHIPSLSGISANRFGVIFNYKMNGELMIAAIFNALMCNTSL